MKYWRKSWLCIAGTVIMLAGCSGQESQPAASDHEGKLMVVTTFYPMYEFSRQIAGELADVKMLVPAGVEPHDWEPSAKDIAQVKEADLFVYNGIVEAWAEGALESAGNESRIEVEASHGISLIEGAEGEEGEEEVHHDEAGEEEHIHDHGGLDPHVWLDPVLAQQQVNAILAGFEQADPANEAVYRQNAEAYIAKLKQLDEAYKVGLSSSAGKELITQHAAFGYMAKQYGLTQVPIAGLSPEQEPSADRMADLVEFAKAHRVTTIFFETLVDPKVAQTVADEIGAKTAVLNPLEGLTDEEQAEGLDYIGVMMNNLQALKQALQ